MCSAVNKEQEDGDIRKCREDVLRVRDIIPPFEELPDEDSARHKKTENAARSAGAQESTAAGRDRPPEKAKTSKREEEHIHSQAAKGQAERPPERGDASRIPEFNLAEQIMAEQRRITATTRKAPTPRSQLEQGPGAQPGRRFSSEGAFAAIEGLCDPVIVEIVARDIEKLYAQQF